MRLHNYNFETPYSFDEYFVAYRPQKSLLFAVNQQNNFVLFIIDNRQLHASRVRRTYPLHFARKYKRLYIESQAYTHKYTHTHTQTHNTHTHTLKHTHTYTHIHTHTEAQYIIFVLHFVNELNKPKVVMYVISTECYLYTLYYFNFL